jgi:hypothetical protein
VALQLVKKARYEGMVVSTTHRQQRVAKTLSDQDDSREFATQHEATEMNQSSYSEQGTTGLMAEEVLFPNKQVPWSQWHGTADTRRVNALVTHSLP